MEYADYEPDLDHYAEIADIAVEQARLCYEGLLHRVFEFQLSFEEARHLMHDAYPNFDLPPVFTSEAHHGGH